MPIWKFGPDSARIKIAYGPITMGVSATVKGIGLRMPITMNGSMGASGGDLLKVQQFSMAQMERPMVNVACKLTQAGGLPELEVPIKYFTAQMTSEGKEYVSVTIPSIDLAGEIADRADGLLTLTRTSQGAGNARMQEEFVRAPIQRIQVYEGSKNQSIVLEASK